MNRFEAEYHLLKYVFNMIEEVAESDGGSDFFEYKYPDVREHDLVPFSQDEIDEIMVVSKRVRYKMSSRIDYLRTKFNTTYIEQLEEIFAERLAKSKPLR